MSRIAPEELVEGEFYEIRYFPRRSAADAAPKIFHAQFVLTSDLYKDDLSAFAKLLKPQFRKDVRFDFNEDSEWGDVIPDYSEYFKTHVEIHLEDHVEFMFDNAEFGDSGLSMSDFDDFMFGNDGLWLTHHLGKFEFYQ